MEHCQEPERPNWLSFWCGCLVGIVPWQDYLFGRATYMLQRLTAKSALAWQVFAGALAT